MKYDYTSVKNIYIVCGKTDMRKGIDGLATLVHEYCEQIEPPVRMIEPASAINRATQCERESH